MGGGYTYYLYQWTYIYWQYYETDVIVVGEE